MATNLAGMPSYSTIAGVHGVLPPHRYTQDEITEALLALPGYEGLEDAVRGLHKSAKVNSRYLVRPLEEYAALPVGDDGRGRHDQAVRPGGVRIVVVLGSGHGAQPSTGWAVSHAASKLPA